MRYTDADLLSPDAALQLMAIVDRWCRRTGTNYHRLVTAARVPPNTRAGVRQGKRRLTFTLAQRLTDTMEKNPYGITKQQHLVNRLTPAAPFIHQVIPEPVDRSPCPRCGVRKDIGCKHFPIRL
jgi:hypothetical protein